MSRSFKDNKGHEWLIDITHAHAIEFEETLGVNIDAIFDEKMSLLTRLSTDRKLFASMLFMVLADEIKTQGLSEKDFYKRLNQQAVEAAATALVNAIVFFSRGETVGKALMESAKKVSDLQMEMSLSRLAGATEELLAGLSANAGNSVASSGSTRGRSRSAR